MATTNIPPYPGAPVVGKDAAGRPLYDAAAGPSTPAAKTPIGGPTAPPVVPGPSTAPPVIPASPYASSPYGTAPVQGGFSGGTPVAAPGAAAGGQGDVTAGDVGKAVLTGGYYGRTGTDLDKYGPKQVLGMLGLGGGGGSGASAYDAAGNLRGATVNTQGVYDQSMRNAQAAAAGPKYQQVKAPTPITTSAITAQTVTPSGVISGQPADALRAQQLDQAAIAANSPSSAAAQMRAAGTQIQQQQAGMAAQARGADRAAAKRDALLATGTQGMQAANQTAALAAQEQAAKQQAYTQALSGVRAGDVNVGQVDLAAQRANQDTNLTAQQATQQGIINAGNINTQASLESQKANQTAGLQAYTATQQAQNAYLGSATQAQGAQNQAAGVAQSYATGQDEAAAKKQTGLLSAGGGLVKSLSDERAKSDMTSLSGPYGTPAPVSSDPYGSMPKKNFLDWMPTAPSPKEESSGGLLGSILSDERAKQEVDALGGEGVLDWAKEVEPITYRYKPGFEDGGKDARLGVGAKKFQESGPYGAMAVHRDPYSGMLTVDPLAVSTLALMAAREAGDKADGKRKAGR